LTGDADVTPEQAEAILPPMAVIVPPNVMVALKDAKARLHAAFGERLVSVKLFGSYARGEATERSDVDVLVVLDEVHGHAERNAA
jgi:predicted nucleotidyltransferase